ncbi:MAG: hypothetical protein ACE5IM_06050 [Nitrospinota bacterium]
MKRTFCLILGAIAALAWRPQAAQAEILAMVNYETKPDQTIRREGIAIIDVDPESKHFGKILVDIPLPADLIAHHIFYNKDASKAYVTALGKSVLHVMDMKRFPYRMKAVPSPGARPSRMSSSPTTTRPGTSPAWGPRTWSSGTRWRTGRNGSFRFPRSTRTGSASTTASTG